MNKKNKIRNIFICKNICFAFFLYCAFYNVLLAQISEAILIKEGLLLKLPNGYQETIISPNPIEAALALDKWKSPKENDVVKQGGDEFGKWQQVKADENGWFSDSLFEGAYFYTSLDLDKKNIMILEAMGDDMVYVNGSPRSGNPYCLKDKFESWETNFDFSFLPVYLNKGKNEFIFKCSRGRLKAKLFEPLLPVMFNKNDMTLPDLITGEKIDSWASIVIVNSSSETQKNIFIKASVEDNEDETSPVIVIQALSVKKAAFHITGSPIKEKGSRIVKLFLCKAVNQKTEILDTISITLRVLDQEENHKETFISKIDGSVQYYGITPADNKDKTESVALFLSLHGAGVDAINQSGSYFHKTWGHIVAPTNRRPYGFNWEEWGQLDALETIDIIKSRYKIDENRIYLTGHSMGGHGTWHIGSLYPDKFAAIGPSAGWISFWTYRFHGMDTIDVTDIRKMIRRATTPSETFMHVENYKQFGVYIIHGSEDDNVFPDESHKMVSKLNKVHKDFVYYEQKGAGHWWDNSDEPGADCIDWPPMYDFFARHARPGKERIREIDFLTSNPGVSAKNNWLTIDMQNKQLEVSSVNILFDPGLCRFTGFTKNVKRLAFDLDILQNGGPVTVKLDSQKIDNINISKDQKQLWLEYDNEKWSVGSEPGLEKKSHLRYGTIKEVFRNKVVFVYGTKGTPEENKWAFDKARYDAEKLWYQGNGSIDVIPDSDFKPSKNPDQNVMLYGNKKTNAAWSSLLSDSPVQVLENKITMDNEIIEGKNLGCILVRPRAGSRVASIGAISGTGLEGMKSCNRLPYMNPGIGLPDCTIFNSNILTKGDNGILITGFFGFDWSIKNGEFVRNIKE